MQVKFKYKERAEGKRPVTPKAKSGSQQGQVPSSADTHMRVGQLKVKHRSPESQRMGKTGSLEGQEWVTGRARAKL